MDILLAIKLILLVLVANGAPIVARCLFMGHFERTLDNGLLLRDGRPLFGSSKTWRGIAASILLTSLVAWLTGLPAYAGTQIAALAMLGDLLSSFTKRRLGIPSSGMAFGLDQIPESLLPLLVVGREFGLSWPQVALLTLLFIALELILSRVLYRLNIRNQPY